MHIEINAGGLGGIAIAEYQSNMSTLISDAEKVISSFKTVIDSTCELYGGAGNLQTAISDISSRVQQEIEKKEAAINVQKKSNDFLELASRVDKAVSTLVNKNKEEFYRVNPWLRPPETRVEEKPWYEKTWDWLCGKGEALVEGAKKAWNWIGDTAKKAWDGLVEFYQEHKKIIDTVLIVVGAVLAVAAVVATGGVALVPLLGALGVSTATAITISTTVAVVAVVSTVVSSTVNVVDIWCEIDNPVFNTFQKAVNVVSAVSNITYSVGNVYNSIKGINPKDYVASHSTSSMKTETIKFDDTIELGQDKFSNQRYYSKGEHYDEYMEFWESGGKDYSYVKVEGSQVEYVNSRNIEGVFLNDSEVKNPKVFWNKRYSKSEYLEYVTNGGINNSPIEVTKVNDSFYYFNGDGRHRILAAQEMNIDIPVIIKGIYTK